MYSGKKITFTDEGEASELLVLEYDQIQEEHWVKRSGKPRQYLDIGEFLFFHPEAEVSDVEADDPLILELSLEEQGGRMRRAARSAAARIAHAAAESSPEEEDAPPPPKRSRPSKKPEVTITVSVSGQAAPNAWSKLMECPIALAIMHDPVVAEDGHTYERSEILKWFARGKKTSPMIHSEMGTKLVPNHVVKSMIAEFLESNNLHV